MSFVYDAGLFVAAERNDREVWADHRARLELGLIPRTTALVVAQVSRTAKWLRHALATLRCVLNTPYAQQSAQGS